MEDGLTRKHRVRTARQKPSTSALPADLVESVARLLRWISEVRLQLATAERCCGGPFASLLSDIEDASNAFDRGFVV